MRNIIDFIIKYQFLFIFLFLESIAFYFILNKNEYHNAKYQSFAQQINGKIELKKTQIKQYLNLKKINDHLAAENEQLKNIIAIYKSNYNINKDNIKDKQYDYYICRVINNSINKQYNYITIDKGSNHGLKPQMAVISSEGAVGIIQAVSPNYSLVISLLNRNIKVSAKLKKNNYFGSFEWSGTSYKKAFLNEIPLHVDVKKGDTVVTSGFSYIFPEGIPLGIVEDVKVSSGTFYDITLNMTTDFKNLFYVYVIENNHQKEQDELENKIKND